MTCKLLVTANNIVLSIRDNRMAFCLLTDLSTRDLIISPRALARGPIMVEAW